MGFLNRFKGKVRFDLGTLTHAHIDAITAHAGGGKASATPITRTITRVTTVASASDSVLAPPAIGGSMFVLINDGANALKIFGQGTDTIDAVATATGNAMAAAKRATFYCHIAGAWSSVAGAVIS